MRVLERIELLSHRMRLEAALAKHRDLDDYRTRVIPVLERVARSLDGATAEIRAVQKGDQ